MLLTVLLWSGAAAALDHGPEGTRVYGGMRAGGPPLPAAAVLEVDRNRRNLRLDGQAELGVGWATDSGADIGGGAALRVGIPIWQFGRYGSDIQNRPSLYEGYYWVDTYRNVPKRVTLGPVVGVSSWLGPAVPRWTDGAPAYVAGHLGAELHWRWNTSAFTGRRSLRVEGLVGPGGDINWHPISNPSRFGARAELTSTAGGHDFRPDLTLSAGWWPRMGLSGTFGFRFPLGGA